MAVVIVALDTTVLNVAIPTILREFDTTLPSLQWVITGYALTFASLLIIGGRLGDIFGHRRMFVIGAAMFGTGSLLAGLSQNVAMLIVGEAIIEGMGASLMMPATLAILSTSFVGRERATAFALWGAVGGASGALGPVIGGVLTSNLSWRWAFGINVIVTPLAIVGALLFMAKGERKQHREPLDVPGAVLIATGMFLLVFGLSEGATYGWWAPLRGFTIGAMTVWPVSMPVSIVVAAFVAAVALLTGFVLVERAKERRDAAPLFAFGELRHLGFRYGLLVTVVMSLGQFGLSFVLPIFLQEGKHLSAQENGLWQLPLGLMVLVGAQIGGRLAHRIGVLPVIRIGLASAASAFLYIAFSLGPDITFPRLLPGLIFYGLGFGLSVAQLTNVVLSDVSPEKSGAAGGANNTARQVGFSIGIAVIGTLLSSRTIAVAVHRVNGATALSPGVQDAAVSTIRASGVTFVPPPTATAAETSLLERLFVDAISIGARTPLVFAASAVLISLGITWLIPKPDERPSIPPPSTSPTKKLGVPARRGPRSEARGGHHPHGACAAVGATTGR
ncbi:MAG: MFS transporter [Ilumatobacteraceae bacterium]